MERPQRECSVSISISSRSGIGLVSISSKSAALNNEVEFADPARHLGSSSPEHSRISETDGCSAPFEIYTSPECCLNPHSSSGRSGTGSLICVSRLYFTSPAPSASPKTPSMKSLSPAFPTRGSPNVVTVVLHPRPSSSRPASAATAPPSE